MIGNKKIFFALALLLISFAGCVSRDTVVSTSVNPAEIYQDYSIHGSQKETTTYAFFLVGGSSGTTVELASPSKAELNDVPMTKSAANLLKGTSYIAVEKGYQARHQITFTDSAGKIYRNTITFDPIEFNPHEAVILRRSKMNFVPVTRISVDDGEQLNLNLSNEDPITHQKNSVVVYLPVTLDPSKRALVITPETLQKMPNGNGMIVMQTGRSMSLEQKTKAGGNLRISYGAKPLKVKIIP